MPKNQFQQNGNSSRSKGRDLEYDDDPDQYAQSASSKKKNLTGKMGRNSNRIESTRSIMELDMSEDDSMDEFDNVSEDSGINATSESEQEGMEIDQNSAGSDEEEEEEFDDRHWGTKKSSYYKKNDDSDDEQVDSEGDGEGELEEATRLQRRRAQELTEEDYGDTFQSQVKSPKDGPQKPSRGKATMTSTDAGLLESMYKEMALTSASDLTLDGKDLASLSKQEKLDLISKDSPELFFLLDSFNAKIVEIRERLAPLIQRARDKQIPTSHGMSYLEAKYHLLLNYCTNVCFYLLLKAEGQQVKNHPVIEHLAKTRIILDRLKPLDQKLKYQIDKLLKMAAHGEASTQQMDPKLRQKANLKNFVPLDDDSDKFDSKSQESGEDDMMNEDDINGKADKKYTAPKIAPVMENRALKQKMREERKAKHGAMAQYLEEEYGERPIERSHGASASNKALREAEEERARYEEDNFVRLGLTKKERKEMNKVQRSFVDNLDDLADYGDLEALDRADTLHEATELESKASRKQKSNSNLSSILDSIDKKAQDSSLHVQIHGVDEDIDYESIRQERQAKRRKLAEDREAAEAQHLYDMELVKKAQKEVPLQLESKGSKKKSAIQDADSDDDEFYREAAAAMEQSKIDRKAIAKERRDERRSERDAQRAIDDNDDEMETDGMTDGKRKVSKEIEANRGLRKHKKKELKNSRVKYKGRYKDAVHRMRGRGVTDATTQQKFSGESAGINKRVVRSTML